MGAFTYIETDTGTNVDISAATAVGAYTSTGDKLIMVDVSIDAVAGNGDYVMYVTRQIGGSGSAYRILPQTTMTAASGLTAISAQSGWITVRNGDVLTCYVDGLAGDTSTPDWTTRWFELAGVTAAAVADAVWDEATADHTTASSFGALDANVDAILADTGTDGVKIASAQTVATVTNLTNLPTMPTDWVTAAGLKADAVAEIADAVWDEDIFAHQNEDSAGLALLYLADAGFPTVETIADAVWDEAIAFHATPNTFGSKNQKVVPSETINDYKADVSGLATQASVNAIPTTPLLAANYTAPDNTSIAAILEDTGTTIPTTLAGLATSAEVGAITMLDEVVVGSYTMQDILKILAAKMVGKATGGGTATITYSGVDDTSNVVVETVDTNGNRSAVTLTV